MKIKTFLALTSLSLLISTSLFADASDVEVNAFIKAANLEEQVKSGFDAGFKEFDNFDNEKKKVEEVFKSKGAKDDHVKKRMDAMQKVYDASKKLREDVVPEILKQIREFYKKTFTDAELKKLTEFYTSPEMKKFQAESLKAMPEVMAKGSKMAEEKMGPIMEEFMKINQELDAELMKNMNSTPQLPSPTAAPETSK